MVHSSGGILYCAEKEASQDQEPVTLMWCLVQRGSTPCGPTVLNPATDISSVF